MLFASCSEPCCGQLEELNKEPLIATDSPKRNSVLTADHLRDLEEYNKEPRLLLVSDHLPNYNVLVCAVKYSTTCIVVRYADWDLEDLTEHLRTLAGEPTKQFASVGLLDHGTQGSFNLLQEVADDGVDLKDLKHNPALQEFFKFVAGYVKAPKELHRWRTDLDSRIDLMACSVAGSREGLELIKMLEDITHVNWAASVDKTGNTGDGFDWDMETEDGLGPVNQCYFRTESLKAWHDSAGCVEWGLAGFKGPYALIGLAVSTTCGRPTSIRVYNDFTLPILVAFSEEGGFNIQGPMKVEPGHDSDRSWGTTHPRKRTVWMSFTGKQWSYQEHVAQDEGPKGKDGQPIGWLRRATWIWKDGTKQDFIGFDINNAAESIVNNVSQLGDSVKEFVLRELDKFKEVLQSINLSDLQKFAKDQPKPTTLKDYTKSKKQQKKQKLLKKHTSSQKADTIFESFWEDSDANLSDPSGTLHNEVHKLRSNAEDIRYVLMDTCDSLGDMRDLLDTPKLLIKDCKDFKQAIQATTSCMKLVNFTTSGPVGAVVNSVKKCVEKGMQAVAGAIKKTQKDLEHIEKTFKLQDKRQRLAKKQEDLMEKMHLKKMEEANFKLAQLEQSTKGLSTRWPKNSGKLPALAVETAESAMQSTGEKFSACNEKIAPYAKSCRNVRGVFGIVNYVVVTKKAIRDTYEPILNFFKALEEALMCIYEKVVKPIADLPIVNEILELFSELTDWLFDEIGKLTGLDKLASWVGDKMNPFCAFEDIQTQMKSTLGESFEAYVAYVEAMKAANELEEFLKTAKIPKEK